MAGKKYISLDTTTGKLKQVAATDQSLGAGNAGDIVALDSSGKIDPSCLPSGSGEGTGGTVHAMTCTEALDAGSWVNIYNNSGTRACRKALAQDATKPANGFVKTSYSAGVTANVYVDGTNDKIPVAGFSAADLSARVFLSPSVAGGCTKTCPSTSGNLVQPLGCIVGIDGTNVSIELDFGEQIIF